MMGPATSGVNPWLLIEASIEGVLRFATVMPSSRPRVSAIHEIAIAGVPTFTDALQQFEREKGVPLRGLQCAMAIAGGTEGRRGSRSFQAGSSTAPFSHRRRGHPGTGPPIDAARRSRHTS